MDSSAALIATLPRSGAWIEDNLPRKPPIGVLFAATMNTSLPTDVEENPYLIVRIILIRL